MAEKLEFLIARVEALEGALRERDEMINELVKDLANARND